MKIGIDIETGPADDYGTALRPYDPDFYVKMIGVSRHDGRSKIFRNSDEALDALNQDYLEFVAWNAKFDCAGLLTQSDEWLQKSWRDGYLAFCWAFPQWHKPGGMSLVQAAHFAGLPWTDLLEEMKRREKEEGFATDATEDYCKLDALTALRLEEFAVEKMSPKQLEGYLIECACIPFVARSWLNGLHIDAAYLNDLQIELHTKIEELMSSGKLPSEEVLKSPDQLAQWLYGDLSLPIEFFTPKGKPSTAKDALKFAAMRDERAALVFQFRELNTRMTKFVTSPLQSIMFNSMNKTFPEPRLFGTYTGRMTYSSKTLDVHPSGIALHQWPRDKRFRRMIVPPPGYVLVEYDFSGQEMRLMGEASQDERMIDIFRPGGIGDAHSLTGAAISGLTFEEFLRRKKAEDKEIVGPKGYRYQGKFVNLSLQYRTSAKKLRVKALTDYDYYATLEEAKHWHRTYHRLYPGVRDYWNVAISKGRSAGYAETFGARRTLTPSEYFVSDTYQWAVESTSINHPIQGTGADMKELALSEVSLSFPEAIFAFDLHDGLFFYLPEDRAMELALEIGHTLNRLDWQARFDRELACEYPVECAMGKTWGDLHEVKL